MPSGWSRRWTATEGRGSELPAIAAFVILTGWILFVAPEFAIASASNRAAWLAVVGGAAIGVAIGAGLGRVRLAVTAGVVGLALVATVVLREPITTVVARIVGLLVEVDIVGRRPDRSAAGWLAFAGIVAVATGVAVGRARRVGVRPRELLVGAVLAAFVAGDIQVVGRQGLRDLHLYLDAGRAFLDGLPVYVTQPLGAMPDDLATLPFLYPPVAIPIFAALASLPAVIADGAWLIGCVAAAIASLRLFGVAWRWLPVLLAWPALFEGIWVGNVAVPALLIVAIAPRVPGALPLSVLSKIQFGVPSIWLVRTKRWRALAAGIAALAGLGLVTLPIVGVSAWSDWVAGLQAFQESQRAVPALYGLSLPGFLPYPAYLAIAAVAVVVATIFGLGLRGLARLGIASIVASPSLSRHGFLVALPALLGNRSTTVWLAFGIASTTAGWWAFAAIAAIGTARVFAGRTAATDELHPLGPDGEPWAMGGRPGPAGRWSN